MTRAFLEDARGAVANRARHATIDPLTSLRAPFAAWVMLYHAWVLFPDAAGPLANVAHVGYAGVSYFFVLSGFVLTYTYPQLPHAGRGAFWLARFARVYPVFVLGLLLALPFVAKEVVHGERTLAQAGGTLLLQLSLTQAWVPGAELSWNYVGWSLSVEAFFYALFPLLSAALARRSDRTVLLVALAAWGLELAVALAGAWRSPAYLGVAATTHAYADSAIHDAFRFNPLLRLPEFVAGIVTALVFLRHRAAIARHSALLAGGGMLATLLVASFATPWLPFAAVHDGAFAPLACLTIVGFAACGGRLARLASTPAMVRLGEASYALYVVHAPMLALVLYVDRRLGVAATQPMAVFAAYVLACVAASLAIHRYVEEPARRALRRRRADASRPSGARAQATSSTGAGARTRGRRAASASAAARTGA